MAKNRPKMLKTDPMAHQRIMNLVSRAEVEQEIRLSTQEITRRMAKSRAFDIMEKELIEDAKAKKILFGGRKQR